MTRCKGIIPALLTPYDADGSVNPAAFKPLVDRLLAAGIGGLFVCGGTGEWWLLSEDERKRVLEAALAAVAGRTKVMIHVGATSTAMSVRLARHAESAGAAAISALPPIGFPLPPECIWDHFRAIGDSCRLPLYLYHVPQAYGDLITIDKFVDALDRMPTLAGAKFSSYRIDDMINLKLKARGRLNILSGCGEQLLSAMACGAEGSICTWYNFLPRLAVQVIADVNANRVEAARGHQDLIVEFGMLCIKKHLSCLKWLVGRSGIPCGRPRLPLPDLTPAECEALLPKLEATGIFKWAL